MRITIDIINGTIIFHTTQVIAKQHKKYKVEQLPIL